MSPAKTGAQEKKDLMEARETTENRDHRENLVMMGKMVNKEWEANLERLERRVLQAIRGLKVLKGQLVSQESQESQVHQAKMVVMESTEILVIPPLLELALVKRVIQVLQENQVPQVQRKENLETGVAKDLLGSKESRDLKGRLETTAYQSDHLEKMGHLDLLENQDLLGHLESLANLDSLDLPESPESEPQVILAMMEKTVLMGHQVNQVKQEKRDQLENQANQVLGLEMMDHLGPQVPKGHLEKQGQQEVRVSQERRVQRAKKVLREQKENPVTQDLKDKREVLETLVKTVIYLSSLIQRPVNLHKNWSFGSTSSAKF